MKYNTFVESGYIRCVRDEALSLLLQSSLADAQVLAHTMCSFDTTSKMNGEFSNNIFKKAVNSNPLIPAGNLFWGNSQGINFYNNMYYGTLTSNTPYSVGTGTKKGPPNVSKLPPPTLPTNLPCMVCLS